MGNIGHLELCGIQTDLGRVLVWCDFMEERGVDSHLLNTLRLVIRAKPQHVNFTSSGSQVCREPMYVWKKAVYFELPHESRSFDCGIAVSFKAREWARLKSKSKIIKRLCKDAKTRKY